MRTRHGEILLACVLATVVLTKCAVSAGRPPSQAERLAATEAKSSNPFAEIRHYMDSILDSDRKVIQNSFAYSGEPKAEDAKLADAVKRNEKSVKGIMEVVTSGRVEERISGERAGAEGVMEMVPETATMRSAVRFLCNAAYTAHKSGDTHAANERLVAAVKLAGAAGASRSQTWHIIGVGCLVAPYVTARTMYRESAIDESDAAALSDAFYHASDNGKRMAAFASIWEDSDMCRDLNAYIAVHVMEPPEAGEESETPSVEAKSGMERGGMNLDSKALREQFRRDTEANEALRQRVLGTVTWPFYTLPKDDFWSGLVAGKTGTAGLPMTQNAEDLVTHWIEWSNNELARRDLLDIVIQIRTFEAANGRLPETLEELSAFVQESMAAGDVCFALLGFVDVYSGEAYRYTVTKDDSGKAVGFKVYSVGIDLKDDGGIERPGLEGKEKGSDIVFEGGAVAPKS